VSRCLPKKSLGSRKQYEETWRKESQLKKKSEILRKGGKEVKKPDPLAENRNPEEVQQEVQQSRGKEGN